MAALQNEATMQTSIGSLQVNNVTMQARNATMGGNNMSNTVFVVL
jgi:hypothetical protein